MSLASAPAQPVLPDPSTPVEGSGPAFGFLVIDKPAGPTSHGCVAAVRRAYGLRRVGHGGTLDPAVTGVLPIALGQATRLLPFLRGEKAYRGVVQLGIRTSSDDLQGDVLERRPPPTLHAADLERLLADFRGAILQRPPNVSAVHVQGERAYARARRGDDLALAARPVTIHRLELLGWDADSGRLDLAIACSAGTYIRALARDLGDRIGCGGALAWLRRTEALGFDLSGAVDLERLAASPPPPLLDPLSALMHLPQRRLTQDELQGWRCGRSLALVPVHADQDPDVAAMDPTPLPTPSPPSSPVAVLRPEGRLAGIADAGEDGLLHPRVVLDAAG